MRRFKKIRGHKRIWKDIDHWIDHVKELDLAYLQQHQREYVKVWVPPFRNISVLNSEFSPPQGKTRQKIIDGIFTVYAQWKTSLETLNQPYYLKIWYFPHDVSKCQVVCAIGDFLNFYDITFYKPDNSKPFPEPSRGLSWEYRHQEIHVTEDDLEAPDMFASHQDYVEHTKWVEGIMRHPKVRITKHPLEDGTEKTYYSIRECDVWLGGD